jgi:hypothetical protein
MMDAISELEDEIYTLQGISKPFLLCCSGFRKKYPVALELTEFMGVAPGTLISRSETQPAICRYIYDNDLAIGNRITPDLTLQILLQTDEQMTYPDVIRRMQRLFPTRDEAARMQGVSI